MQYWVWTNFSKSRQITSISEFMHDKMLRANARENNQRDCHPSWNAHDINKHLTQQHPLGIHSAVSQFLRLMHVIKGSWTCCFRVKHVAWAASSTPKCKESLGWVVTHRQEAASANSAQQVYWCCWGATGYNRPVTLSLQMHPKWDLYLPTPHAKVIFSICFHLYFLFFSIDTLCVSL